MERILGKFYEKYQTLKKIVHALCKILAIGHFVRNSMYLRHCNINLSEYWLENCTFDFTTPTFVETQTFLFLTHR